MTIRRRFALVLCAAAAILAPQARAQEAIVELDPDQTQINFTLGATLHTVHGSFKLKRGVIRYDISTGKAGGEIVVDATSGNSSNASRDRKMHSEVLESPKFPEIIFVPDRLEGKVTPQGESQVQMHGLFKIHGSDHEMTLTAQVQIAAGRPAATIHFVVPYVQWGLKNPSAFLLRVSDKVEIDIHAAGRIAAPQQKIALVFGPAVTALQERTCGVEAQRYAISP